MSEWMRFFNFLFFTPLINIRDSILNQKLWLITDNNMASEYKEVIWHKSK